MEPMNKGQFQLQIQRLESAFPGKHFSGQRVDLIWSAVCFLDIDSFMKIVDNMISSFRFAPLPKDFADAAKEERNKETKWLSQDERNKIEATPIKCRQCFDSGIVYLKNQHGTEVWSRCNCELGITNPSLLPIYSPQWPNHKLQRFPSEDWIPKEIGTLENLMNGWNEKKRISELYWKSLGFKRDCAAIELNNSKQEMGQTTLKIKQNQSSNEIET